MKINKTKVRHVLGISGGKDSAALAIYLNQRYSDLNIEYYFCDTGKELKETLELVDRIESYLGKEIKRLKATNLTESGNEWMSSTKLMPATSVKPTRNQGY